MPTSQRRIDANRRNAARSTGARTERGRRISSMNALKHGMASRQDVVPGEERPRAGPTAHDSWLATLLLRKIRSRDVWSRLPSKRPGGLIGSCGCRRKQRMSNSRLPSSVTASWLLSSASDSFTTPTQGRSELYGLGRYRSSRAKDLMVRHIVPDPRNQSPQHAGHSHRLNSRRR